MSKKEILAEVLSLPIEDRLEIADTLVQTFNPMAPEIEESWLEEVDRRKNLLKNNEANSISYQEFFSAN